MKKRKKKIPGKIGSHQLSHHSIKRVKERGILVSDLEKALKYGEIEDSILKYKHLEIVLSEDKANMVTVWNNGKEVSSTVLSKKEQKLLSLKFSENLEIKKEIKADETIEFDSYEDYLNFLKSNR